MIYACFARGLFLLCICIAVAGCQDQSPQELVAAARVDLDNGNGKSAVVRLKSALQRNSELAEGRFLLGRALFDTGDLLSAEKELRKALDLGYPRPEVAPTLARTLASLGKYKEALEFGDAKTSGARATAELQAALGDSQLGVGNLDAARAAYAAATAADPKYAPGIVGSARLMANAGDLSGALQQTETALAGSRGSAETWQLKGDILAAQKQPDAAIMAYRTAIETRRDFIPAHAALITTLLQTDKVEDAANALPQLKEVAPRIPLTSYLEALVLFQQKKYKNAREAIERELQLAPDDARGNLLAASIDYELHTYAEAEERLQRLVRTYPNWDYARQLLATVYLRGGKPDRAVDALKPILPRIDKDASLLKLTAEAYLQKGDAATAANYFEKATKLEPSVSAPRTGLALAHIAAGNTEGGVRELELIAASDPGTTADLALIATSMQRRDFDTALRAIGSLEQKQPNKPLPANLRGLALLGKGDAVGARRSFERAVSVDGDFFPAVANLARLDLAENNNAAARQRLDAAVAKNPKNGQALLALAELSAKENAAPEQVISSINKAITANSEDVPARLALVRYHLSRKEPKLAVAAAQEAAAAMPKRVEILEALAEAQKQTGDINQALMTYGRIADLLPDSPVPLLRVAELQAASKDFDAALGSYRRALTIQPDLIAAQKGLISVYVATNRLPDAVMVAHQVQKQHPKDAAGYIFEGDLHARRKAWDDALIAYRTAVRQSGSSEAAVRVHVALVSSGQTQQAEKADAGWLKDHPKDTAYRLFLAEDASRRGDFRTAQQHYRVLVTQQPNNAAFLNNMAWVAGRLNDSKAIEYAEKANNLAPNQAPILDTLGVLLVDSGDIKQGIELLRKATALSPSSPNIRLNLAKALIKAGDAQDAKKELDKLAQLGDKYPGQTEVARLRAAL